MESLGKKSSKRNHKMDTKQLKQILIQLAARAASPNLISNPLALPNTWKSLTTKSVFAPGVGNLQISLAYGNVGDEVIACMAIGWPWQNILGQYHSGFNPENRQMLPTSVMGNPQGNSTVFSPYVIAYNFLRSPVWDALSYLENPGVKGKPLYITGIGIGGPLAQIVAMDFRPGQKGPAQQNPPQDTQPPSYIFSAGNVGTLDFQTIYNQRVVQAYLVTAGTTILPVDLFPSQPVGETLNYEPLGTSDQITTAVPKPYFTPWEVRDSNFYLKALGGTPQAVIPTPTSIPNAPEGFSQSQAFSLGELTALTYQQAMQPDTTGFPNPSPYSIVANIKYSNSLIAIIFINTSSVVVAFRGTITFEEFLSMKADTNTANTPYGEMVTSGANNVYYGSPDSDGVILADVVKEEVLKYVDGKKLYLTGHGFGGVLANMAAADFTFNMDTPIAINGIYTFGSNYWAGTAFAANFSEKLGSVSYQILRPSDSIATALKTLPIFNPIDNIVALIGQLDFIEDTDHALSSYLNLLDPSRTT